MPADVDPIPGNWYQHLDEGQKFQVLAVDEENGLIEIQYFDGDVNELDWEAWTDMAVEPIEPPEDFTGPLDDIERDDLDYQAVDMQEEDWEEPYRKEKTTQRESPGAEPQGTPDDWNEGYLEENTWDESPEGEK